MAKRRVGTWSKGGEGGDAVKTRDGMVECIGFNQYSSEDHAKRNGVSFTWDDETASPPAPIENVTVAPTKRLPDSEGWWLSRWDGESPWRPRMILDSARGLGLFCAGGAPIDDPRWEWGHKIDLENYDPNKPWPAERLVAVELPDDSRVRRIVEAHTHNTTVDHRIAALNAILREQADMLNLPSEHANADAMQRIDEKLKADFAELRRQWDEAKTKLGAIRLIVGEDE